MEAGDRFDSLQSKVKDLETMRLELDAFQKHLAEVESVIGELITYHATELESFWFIRRLILKNIDELRQEIEKAV